MPEVQVFEGDGIKRYLPPSWNLGTEQPGSWKVWLGEAGGILGYVKETHLLGYLPKSGSLLRYPPGKYSVYDDLHVTKSNGNIFHWDGKNNAWHQVSSGPA
jgi:hypothetical protein